MVTRLDNRAAFVKEFMYRNANVKDTGSFISTVVASSGLSTEELCLQTMFAVPISSFVENFTPSLVTEMTTTIFIAHSVTNTANPSKLGRRHSNNGMVLCLRNSKVLTVDIHQLHLKIRNLSCVGLSNMKVTVSLPSSPLTVMMSSFPAHRSILAMLLRFIPIEMLRSHR